MRLVGCILVILGTGVIVVPILYLMKKLGGKNERIEEIESDALEARLKLRIIIATSVLLIGVCCFVVLGGWGKFSIGMAVILSGTGLSIVIVNVLRTEIKCATGKMRVYFRFLGIAIYVLVVLSGLELVPIGYGLFTGNLKERLNKADEKWTEWIALQKITVPEGYTWGVYISRGRNQKNQNYVRMRERNTKEVVFAVFQALRHEEFWSDGTWGDESRISVEDLFGRLKSGDIISVDESILTRGQCLAGEINIIRKAGVSKPIHSLLARKFFVVERVEVFDISDAGSGEWRKAEVSVFVEERFSDEHCVFILTCTGKKVVERLKGNLLAGTLIAISNAEKVAKGRVVESGLWKYQEYYLHSASDIAVVREHGSELDEMWRLETEGKVEEEHREVPSDDVSAGEIMEANGAGPEIHVNERYVLEEWHIDAVDGFRAVVKVYIHRDVNPNERFVFFHENLCGEDMAVLRRLNLYKGPTLKFGTRDLKLHKYQGSLEWKGLEYSVYSTNESLYPIGK